MTTDEMLDKALEIINTLEIWADEDTRREIDELYYEVNKNNDTDPDVTADMEAQDYSVFGSHKI